MYLLPYNFLKETMIKDLFFIIIKKNFPLSFFKRTPLNHKMLSNQRYHKKYILLYFLSFPFIFVSYLEKNYFEGQRKRIEVKQKGCCQSSLTSCHLPQDSRNSQMRNYPSARNVFYIFKCLERKE